MGKYKELPDVIIDIVRVLEALEVDAPIPSGTPRGHLLAVLRDDLDNVEACANEALTADEKTGALASVRILRARVDALCS